MLLDLLHNRELARYSGSCVREKEDLALTSGPSPGVEPTGPPLPHTDAGRQSETRGSGERRIPRQAICWQAPASACASAICGGFLSSLFESTSSAKLRFHGWRLTEVIPSAQLNYSFSSPAWQ